MGLFGNLFDFNFEEKTTHLEVLIGIQIMNQSNPGSKGCSSGPQDFGGASRIEDLDFDELELMDEEERNEFLEDSGYDPDDFDF